MIARYLEINSENNKHIQLFKEAGYKLSQIIKNIEKIREGVENDLQNEKKYKMNIYRVRKIVRT